MKYEIKYVDGLWWIVSDGEILKDIGGFVDPISPKIIIKEIEDEEIN